jgi:DNA modification methylase
LSIFESNDIRIINGDSTAIIAELDIDLDKCIFVSDPPFNIGYHYASYKDNLKTDAYFAWLATIFKNYRQVIIHYPENLYKYSFQIGLFPEKVISWVYNSNTAKQHRDIAFFRIKPDMYKVGQEYKNPKDKRIVKQIALGKKARLYDWWEVNQVKNVSVEKTAHPCQMPLKVMLNIIGCLPEGYTIIDPFLGSGTTAIACLRYKRKFIGIEIDATYYEIAKKRIIEEDIRNAKNNN